MAEVGDKVRVLSPFDKAYPDEYTVYHKFVDGSVRIDTPGHLPDGEIFDEKMGANFAEVYVEVVKPSEVTPEVIEAIKNPVTVEGFEAQVVSILESYDFDGKDAHENAAFEIVQLLGKYFEKQAAALETVKVGG